MNSLTAESCQARKRTSAWQPTDSLVGIDILPGAEPAVEAPTIRGLGEITVLRETTFTHPGQAERQRRMELVEMDGYAMLTRVSEADPSLVTDPENVPVTLSLLGFTEVIDAAGTGKSRHTELEKALPGHKIVSFDTDGWTLHGEDLGYKAAWNRDFESAADRRRRATAYYAGKSAVTLHCISMGAPIGFHIAHQNLSAVESEKLNIERIDAIVPCLMAAGVNENEQFRDSLESTKARILTTAEFFGHVGVDAARETTHHPLNAARSAYGYAKLGIASVRHPKKGAALAGNFKNLFGGTPWWLIKEVTRAYDEKLHFYVADRDTFREHAQYAKLRELNPETKFNFHPVPKAGHAKPLDAKGTVALLGYTTGS